MGMSRELCLRSAAVEIILASLRVALLWSSRLHVSYHQATSDDRKTRKYVPQIAASHRSGNGTVNGNVVAGAVFVIVGQTCPRPTTPPTLPTDCFVAGSHWPCLWVGPFVGPNARTGGL